MAQCNTIDVANPKAVKNIKHAVYLVKSDNTEYPNYYRAGSSGTRGGTLRSRLYKHCKSPSKRIPTLLTQKVGNWTPIWGFHCCHWDADCVRRAEHVLHGELAWRFKYDDPSCFVGPDERALLAVLSCIENKLISIL